MKCLLCSAEIDEYKSFPVVTGPQGQRIEDVMGQWTHGQALSSWTHIALTAQHGGGTLVLLSGHICPAHPVKAGSIALVASKAPERAHPPASLPATKKPPIDP
jgi:hypothetical protein